MHQAMLLIGPTGSGKTPLGEWLDEQGLRSRSGRCFHFDFGERLRRVAAGDDRVEAIGREEVKVLRRVLATGALLEDTHLPIAIAILLDFIARREIRGDDIVVLNGLPRHAGQASAVDRLLDVRLVVHLSCTPEVVVERIRGNAGGDRTARRDDDLQAVARRLEIFNRRTAPLLDHYQRRGTTLLTIEVGPAMSAAEMAGALHPPGD